MKTLFNTFYYLLIVCLVAAGVLLLGTLMPIPGNIKVKIVKSGSMEPAIHTGSIVIIRPSTSYNIGDVITFGPDTKTQIPTTHRIISIDGQGVAQIYTTKGDANDAADHTNTRIYDIGGKVVVTVPYIGYVLDFARRPLGFIVLVGLPALAIIIDEVGKIVREYNRIRRKKNKNKPPTSPGDNFGDQERQSVREVFTKSVLSFDGIKRQPSFTQIQLLRKSRAPKLTLSRILSTKSFIIVFVTGISFIGLSSIGNTVSFFNDVEASISNRLNAGVVDLQLISSDTSSTQSTSLSVSSTEETETSSTTPTDQDEESGVGSISFEVSLAKGSKSLPLIYTASTSLDTTNPLGCELLNLEAWIGDYHYNGLLTNFTLGATTTLGTNLFMITVPVGNTALANGALCTGYLAFKAHPIGLLGVPVEAFTDEERYSFKVRNYGTAPKPEDAKNVDPESEETPIPDASETPTVPEESTPSTPEDSPAPSEEVTSPSNQEETVVTETPPSESSVQNSAEDTPSAPSPTEPDPTTE